MTHLTASPDPVMHGSSVETLCGKDISKCVVEFVWDYSEGYLPSMSSLNCCRKCVEKAKQATSGRTLTRGES